MNYEQGGSGVQNLQISEFVGTFSILKIVLAVFVLIFIMYTCRQKLTKHRYGEKSSFSTMDYERSESRTKQDNLPETSSDTLVENEVKKRRVRKKKPRKQNSEYTEESKDEKGATENTETKSTGEENKVVKRRNKAVLSNGPGYDKASYRGVNNSENPDTAGQVEHIKHAKRRNKGFRGKHPPVNYSENADGAAGSTDGVKYVTRHNNVVVGSNYPADSHSSRPIRILKRNDIYDPSSTAEQQVKDVKRHNNVDGSNNHADSHSSRPMRILNRNDIHDPSSTAEQVEDIKRHNNGVPARKDNVMSENPDSSSPPEEVKHVKRQNKTVTSTVANAMSENPDSASPAEEVKHVKRHDKAVASKDANAMSENPDSSSLVEEVKYAKTLGNRNRPGQADHADDSPVKNCASGGVGDVTSHSEHSGVKQRRKSLSSKVKKDSIGTDHKEKASQGETSQRHAKNRSAGRFSWGFPARRWEKPNRDSATVENKPAKDRVHTDTTPRRRSFDRKFEKGFRGRGHSGQHRPSPADNRTTSDELEKSEHECEEVKTMQSVGVPSDQIGTMDRKDDSTPCERNSSIESLKAPTNISQQTSKDIEVLREQVEVRPGAIQETQFTPKGHIYIDPAVRERIAYPKCPVRMPEKPFENLSFRDNTKRENCSKASTNISRVHGLFGRKWRERLEKQQERQYAEEDAKSEDEFLDIRDNICPTFMIWGVCHRGDRCELRHPSYRYLERPKRTPPNPEPETVHEDAKPQDPNSYAAILEKTKPTEPEEFFNDALREDRLTEGSLEESWPALGSPEQGQNTKVPKAWGPKREAPNVPVVWEPLRTTKKGPWISDERSKKATADQLQIASDELIADTLQADEYAQLDEYDENEDDFNYYYPEQELNEEYYEHTEETEADSSDTHQEGKVVDEEPFNSSNSSPVIIEQRTEGSEEPAPPKVSSICDICMDRPKDATLVCGHRYCYQCALQMRLDERVCAICRRCIVSVIKTYN